MGQLDILKNNINIGTLLKDVERKIPKIAREFVEKIKDSNSIDNEEIKQKFVEGLNFVTEIINESTSQSNEDVVHELKGIKKAIEAVGVLPIEHSKASIHEDPTQQEDNIVQSIELKPFPKQGKKDNNQVIVSYSNTETKTHTVTSELFYFLYLLCYQRLNNDKENWVTLKEPIHMIHIAHIEEFMGHKLPRYFSWISTKEQKQTVISKINKNIAPIINRSDEESDEHGQESYYSLINELKGEKSIVLHKM